MSQNDIFIFIFRDQKMSAEHEQVESEDRPDDKVSGQCQRKKSDVGEGYREYFHLEIYEPDGTFLYAREKTDVIQREIDLCGYFVIVTSKKMTAKDALNFIRAGMHRKNCLKEISHTLETGVCGYSPMKW